MTFSPLHYIGGYTAVLFSLMSRAPLVLGQAFGEAAFDQIARYRVRSLGGVTRSHLSELIVRCDADPNLLESLRHINYFGAALNASRLGDVKRVLPQTGLSSGYGLTETSGLIAAGALSDFIARPGTCGRVSPLVDVRVMAQDASTSTSSSEPGAIEIRGAVLASAYVGDGKTTPLRPAWFATGDRGALDADGYLYIDGRDRSVSLAGHTVDLTEMERQVCEVQGVTDVVFALDEARQVLVVGLCPAGIALAPIQKALVQLSGVAAERLRLVAVDRLPMTASGKIARAQAAEMILALS